jgi:ribose transport system substrate-binding protein
MIGKLIAREVGIAMKQLKTLGVVLGLTLMSLTIAQAQETVGPNGEKATPSDAVKVSGADIEALKGGKHTAALLWHTSSDFTNAVTAGATDAFKSYGIEVVATTDAGFDAARQKSDVETILAKKPSVILTLPLDPVTSAEALRPAVEAGTKIVLLSNQPVKFAHGKDYVSIVTDDLFQMGKRAADVLAEAIGKKGKVAWIFHDAQYYVTNQRDNAFKKTVQSSYPDIQIVAEQGLADPARAEEIAQALLLQHPDLDGIYTPWAEPAEGVLAALRSAGNIKTKIVTLDLSEPVALDMVKGGNVAGIVADKAYELGRAMADAAALALLGKATPPFVVAPALTVTKANVAEGWMESLHREAPKTVLEAAK